MEICLLVLIVHKVCGVCRSKPEQQGFGTLSFFLFSFLFDASRIVYAFGREHPTVRVKDWVKFSHVTREEDELEP